PGLVPPIRGLLKDFLFSKSATGAAKNLKTELAAFDLRFLPGSPRKGRIYVSVDNYERAFMYRITFDQGTLTQLSDKTRIRLKAPRYFNPQPDETPGPKGEIKPPPKIPVAIEADGIDGDKWVEVALDRSGEGKYITQYLLPGLREHIITVDVGPEG